MLSFDFNWFMISLIIFSFDFSLSLFCLLFVCSISFLYISKELLIKDWFYSNILELSIREFVWRFLFLCKNDSFGIFWFICDKLYFWKWLFWLLNILIRFWMVELVREIIFRISSVVFWLSISKFFLWKIFIFILTWKNQHQKTSFKSNILIFKLCVKIIEKDFYYYFFKLLDYLFFCILLNIK